MQEAMLDSNILDHIPKELKVADTFDFQGEEMIVKEIKLVNSWSKRKILNCISKSGKIQLYTEIYY